MNTLCFCTFLLVMNPYHPIPMEEFTAPSVSGRGIFLPSCKCTAGGRVFAAITAIYIYKKK